MEPFGHAVDGVHTGTAKHRVVTLVGCPLVPVLITVAQREPLFPAILPQPFPPAPPSSFLAAG